MTFWENDTFKGIRDNAPLFHLLTFLFCFIVPPLACYLVMQQYRYRFENDYRCWVIFIVSIALTLLAWVPGQIFALFMYLFVAIGGCLHNAKN